jgi:hypothetical protein
MLLLALWACTPEPEPQTRTFTIEDCDNGRDDDLDGDADCHDIGDCANDPACLPRVEDCDNGWDDDANGLTDCEDPGCTDACDEICGDGQDNDADGLVDCEDQECGPFPECSEDCDDGVDNDHNGYTDCYDDACWSKPECPDSYALQVLSGSMATETVVDWSRTVEPTDSGSWWRETTWGERTVTTRHLRGVLLAEWGCGSSTACTWTLVSGSHTSLFRHTATAYNT